MSSTFALRIKTKSGQQVLKTLTLNNTVRDLKEHLSSLSEIPVEKLHVLSGFPPKVLDITQDELPLSKTGLTSGDTLILEEKAVSVIDKNKVEENVPKQIVAEDVVIGNGVLMKKVVPADNSCLFSSLFFVMNGKLDDSGTAAPWMRTLIAETLSKDVDMYSEAILGKPNPEYCKWILDDKSWGGAIELSILSNHYGLEIAVVDTINAIINRFGEDQAYALRVFLLFDGIHYDPLYLEPYDGSPIQTMFPVEDDKVFSDAQELAKEAKSSRQFTDVNKFTLKCMVCNVYLNGQVQARDHAQKTGHTDFGEV